MVVENNETIIKNNIMKPISEQIKNKPWLGWLLFLGTMCIVFLLGLLASSIIERRAEALFVYTPSVEHDLLEPRNEIWGQNFPRQFESYYRTADSTFESKFNGSKKEDLLAKYPSMVILWAGYAFSREYNSPRGHFYAVKDVRDILRTGAPVNGEKSPMSNTCWTCKSSDVPRLIHEHGAEGFYSGNWADKGHEVVNFIGCADCHDAKTMNLKITRPALIEAYERMGKDITKATYQEMRSLVCAQCHVEYFFDKRKNADVNYLTFPWDKGLTAEDMEQYFDEFQFSDWIHTISKAPMIKAQHPDYELFTLGIHAQRGLSCADCHMPYRSEGGQKFTDHHIQSPLNNVAASCQVCHREETATLVANVYERQEKIHQSRTILEGLLVKAHFEAGFAWDKGANEQEMKPVLQAIRQAQWRWDFVAASHGGSFHSPLECGRLLADGINKAQNARLHVARILAKKGYSQEVPIPDVSTKEKAQAYIGLDMPKLNANKQEFIRVVVPEWLNAAKEREKKYQVKNI